MTLETQEAPAGHHWAMLSFTMDLANDLDRGQEPPPDGNQVDLMCVSLVVVCDEAVERDAARVGRQVFAASRPPPRFPLFAEVRAQVRRRRRVLPFGS